MPDVSDGIVVLSAKWILDSLDAQTLLPCQYYTVKGIRPPRFSWSIVLYQLSNLDPLSSVKWFLGGFLKNSSSTSPKRQLEEETTEQLQKRRLFIAVNEVEAALSRLNEISASRITSVSETSQDTIHDDNENQVDIEGGIEKADEVVSQMRADSEHIQWDKNADVEREEWDDISCFVPL